ncbi:MAG: low-complexity tail membrane protein [Kaiparowitsia implicata GSE-PSE-MK54-09C]|nr:low-complexity tail membrane protein [Kaiparowitsia implicata GSE-PSE-MK54-09C]
MRSFWSDPYLWIHLAGAAAVPLCLEVCALGLAAGDPVLPVPVEVLLVGIAGIAPPLWLQWQRPFNLYSIYAVCLKPSELTEQQRRTLRPLKSLETQILAIAVAVLMLVLLWKIYQAAPLIASVASSRSRWAGLGLGAIAFFLSNLLMQIAASAGRVLVISAAAAAKLTPYPPDQIPKDFTTLGWRLAHLLPPLVMEPKLSPSAASPTPAAPSKTADSPNWSVDDSPWDDATATPQDKPLPSASPASKTGDRSAVGLDPDSELGLESTSDDALEVTPEMSPVQPLEPGFEPSDQAINIAEEALEPATPEGEMPPQEIDSSPLADQLPDTVADLPVNGANGATNQDALSAAETSTPIKAADTVEVQALEHGELDPSQVINQNLLETQDAEPRSAPETPADRTDEGLSEPPAEQPSDGNSELMPDTTPDNPPEPRPEPSDESSQG